MKTKLLALSGVAALLAGAPALAHHSGAMFDATKEIVLEGTVKQFQWTNPHSWIQLEVPEASGKVTEWSIEWGGVSMLYKQGVRATSLKPGDKVTITAHPLKNGSPGGEVRKIVGADGAQIGGRQG